MTNKKLAIGILGGGISGLSTAYALSKNGISSTVYEKAGNIGGAIHSVRHGDWLVEEGPNTILVKSPELWNLFEELNLDNHIIEANEQAKKRYIVKNANPIVLPFSIGNFFITPLLSVSAKLKLLKEPFVAPSKKHDESVASFIRRRLGRQLLDYGVNPFVSGIFAGDPKQLSMKHTFPKLWEMEQQHGSITKGMFKRDRSNSSKKRALVSFEQGNQMLPQAFADSLPNSIQTSTEITSVKNVGNQWQISGIANGSAFEMSHDCIISTLPTYSLPDIFKPILFDELSTLPYTPLSVLALGFEDDQIRHPLDGFGMLIPEVENYKTLGVLFSSTLFPGRAPDGHQLLTCFIGGARNPQTASKSKDELQSIVLTELNKLLGIKGEPAFVHLKFWNKAIPQYEVGYGHYLSLMNKIEKQYPGLYLDGNYRHGVSVPDCISSGIETAQKVQTFLQSKG
jgi:oxygen-dependent protoporphyrinogen oxidase